MAAALNDLNKTLVEMRDENFKVNEKLTKGVFLEDLVTEMQQTTAAVESLVPVIESSVPTDVRISNADEISANVSAGLGGLAAQVSQDADTLALLSSVVDAHGVPLEEQFKEFSDELAAALQEQALEIVAAKEAAAEDAKRGAVEEVTRVVEPSLRALEDDVVAIKLSAKEVGAAVLKARKVSARADENAKMALSRRGGGATR
jgi:hypothetical protein